MEGSPRAEQGISSLDQYGVGEKDPLTGLYESYEIPRGVIAAEETNEGVSWVDLLEQWRLVVISFRAVYHWDLEAEFRVRSWRWFTTYVAGLLAIDCPLQRHFAPDPEPPTPEVPIG